MIIEQRTYTLRPGKVDEYLSNYERHALPVQPPILGNLIGFFSSEIGPLNQVVHMWGYESMEDRARRRRDLAAHPDWPTYREINDPLVMTQENKILVPAPFSPLR